MTVKKRRGWIARLGADIMFSVRRDKRYWLLPLIVLVLALGALLIFAVTAGPLAPFLYPLL